MFNFFKLNREEKIVKLFNNPFGRWYFGVPKGKKIYKITKTSAHYYTGEVSKRGGDIICTGFLTPNGRNRFFYWLENWKPIHLCWLFIKMGWKIPKYFIGENTSALNCASSVQDTLAFTGGINWTNPNNIQTEDGNFATFSGSGSGFHGYGGACLDCQQFGASVPTVANILGIKFEVKAKVTGSGNFAGGPTGVYIVKGGTAGAMRSSSTSVDTTLQYHTIGGATELFGTTFTAADVNASNFGGCLSTNAAVNTGSVTWNGDHIRMTIYYDMIAGTPNVSDQISVKENIDTGNRYWVGGTGNWDATTTHWSTSSGGLGGASVPTSSTNVVFDSLSSAGSYTVTVSQDIYANDFTVGAPASGTVELYPDDAWTLHVYGNFSTPGGNSGIIWDYWEVDFNASSGTQTIRTYGLSMLDTYMYLVGVGNRQLLDDLTISDSFSMMAGTFDANGHKVTLTGSYGAEISSYTTITFYDLSIIPDTPRKNNSCFISNNIIISNLFTIDVGATITNRILLFSNIRGTPRTITATSISIVNTDFQDIIGAGAANWDLHAITGLSGDCGGNSGMTLTSPVDQHWGNAAGGTWSTTTNWTSRVPLPQDNVFMNKTFGTSSVVTADMPRLGKNIDWTGATWTTSLTYTPSTSTTTSNYMYGSLTLITGLTYTSNTAVLYLYGNGNFTIDCKGVTIGQSVTAQANTTGGTTTTYTLVSNLLLGAIRQFQLYYTSLDVSVNNYIISVGALSISTSAVVKFGSGTHLLNGTGQVLNASVGSIFPSTGTLKITDTSNTAISFYSGANTYNNIWFSRGTSTAINNIYGGQYNNDITSFNDFKDDGSIGHTIKFQAGRVFSVKIWTVSGPSYAGSFTITSSSTAAHYLVKRDGGVISANWLNIQHSIATPVSTWFAGTGSTNNQGVTTVGSGWIFTDPDNAVINVSISDQINVTESNTIYIGLSDKNISVVDSINISENIKDLEQLFLNVSDIINITESKVVLIPTYYININSIINITENLTDSGFLRVSVFDNINVTESKIVTNSQLGGINKFEIINITESKTILIPIYYINIHDNINITENLTDSGFLRVSIFDSINISETKIITNSQLGGINKFDSITISENLNLPPTGLSLISISNITENIKLLIPFLPINVYDSINTTEVISINPLQLIGINVFDSIHVCERSRTYDDSNYTYDSFNLDYDGHTPIQVEITSFIFKVDVINITETITIKNSQLGGINVHDNINITENLTDSGFLRVSVFDNINITESKILNNTQLGGINIYDSINISENLSEKGLILQVNIYDLINITENLSDTGSILQVNIYDLINITENLTEREILHILTFDNINISENIISNNIQLGNINIYDSINISELVTTKNTQLGNINIYDSININISDILTLLNYLNIKDSINITEFIKILSLLNIVTYDSIIITENINSQGFNNISVSDTIIISENFKNLEFLFINKFDNVIITENSKIEEISNININDKINTSELTTLKSFRFSPSIKKPIGSGHSIGNPSGVSTSINTPSGTGKTIGKPPGGVD